MLFTMLRLAGTLLCAMATSFSVSGDMPGEWTPRESGWRFDDNTAAHDDRFFHSGVLGLPGKTFRDARLTAEVKISRVYHEPDSVWAGLLLRAPRPLHRGAWGEGYHFFLRVNGEAVLQRAGGVSLDVAATETRPDEFVRLALEATGTRICGYVDDKLVVEAEDDTYAVGEVALVHYGNETVFRAVIVEGTTVSQTTETEVTPQQPKPEPLPPVTPLPAIGVRKPGSDPAAFYNRDTGAPFLPKGFNHTALSKISDGWHATFNVGHYDPDAMAALLAEMAETGANTIRVWAWGIQDKTGFTGTRDSRGLNAAYMENFVDFLRRCTAHGLYVVPILDETPHNAYYDNVAARADAALPTPHVTGYNVNYLTPGALAAKKQATKDFVQYVKEADPGLLNTVLGWAFANEAFVNHTQGPFHLNEGLAVTLTGRIYDMGNREQRQACYDESILLWCNTLADAVKSVAPDALTTIGIWTSDAHGRDPVNYLLPDDRDPRRPPRPSILAGPDSVLDFLDIHIYPWNGTSTVRPEAHEWKAVKESDKPALVGEYGVFKNKTVEEARVMLREMLEQAFDMGYQGALHWVWDLTEVAGQTWSAVEEDLAAYLMALDVYPEE